MIQEWVALQRWRQDLAVFAVTTFPPLLFLGEGTRLGVPFAAYSDASEVRATAVIDAPHLGVRWLN